MIDIHTHIIPGVDDGVKDIEEALAVLKKAEKQGIKKIVATPHYLEEGYRLSPKETEKKVRQLQEELLKEPIAMEILPGAEVFLTPDLGEKLASKKISTLNHSRYLLIELPAASIPSYSEDVLYDINILGYIPIIAHPERNFSIIEDPNKLYNWIKNGVLAQLNAGSLLGYFGKDVKKTAEILVKHKLVQLIASDVHSCQNRPFCLQKGLKALKDLIGEEASQFIQNAQLVIEDKQLIKPDVKAYSKPSLINKLTSCLFKRKTG